MKGRIARLVELLKPNLRLSDTIFPISFLSKVIKGKLFFPFTLFDTPMTPSHKNYPAIQELYHGKGVYSELVYP